MSEQTLQELIESDAFQEKAAGTDDDAEAAGAAYRNLVSSAEVKGLGAETVAGYKADFARLQRAAEAFNAAVAKAMGGGLDREKLLAVYEHYEICLTALQAQNERFDALAALRIATLCKAVATLTTEAMPNAKKRLLELEGQLEKLAVDLKKAEKDVSGARLQRDINTALSAATLLAGPTGALAKVLVAGAGITAQLATDYVLGPSRGSPDGVANTVIGGSADLVDKLGPLGKKFVSAGSAVLSYKSDSDEIGQAKAVFEAARKKLAAAQRGTEDMLALLEPLGKKARTFATGLDKARAGVKDALQRGVDARNEYADMKKLLKAGG